MDTITHITGRGRTSRPRSRSAEPLVEALDRIAGAPAKAAA
jgi:hypothetical protein